MSRYKTIVCSKEEALSRVRKKFNTLARLEAQWQDDKDVVLAAVKHYGSALKHASRRLRADEEVVKAAIDSEPRALTYAVKELRNNPDMRTYAYSKGNSVFIVDPIAMEVFSLMDAKMINATVKQKVTKREKFTKADGSTGYHETKETVFDEKGFPVFDEEAIINHPTYQKFKKFYKGNITATEMWELEEYLISLRHHYQLSIHQLKDEYPIDEEFDI